MTITDRAAELVQPIVLLVDRDTPAAEVDGVTAVALAAVAAYRADLAAGTDLSDWDAWLSGPFAKSVRRADRKTFDKVDAEFAGTHAHIVVGTAEALAFRPVPANELPRTLSRLQVAGTTLPARPSEQDAVRPYAVTVALDASLGMSTGKAAAQAAHALLLWVLAHDPALPPVCTVLFEDTATIDALVAAHPDAVTIEDAGRTEIEPGSRTAIAF